MLQTHNDDATSLVAIAFTRDHGAVVVPGDLMHQRRVRFGPRRGFRFGLMGVGPDETTSWPDIFAPGTLIEMNLDRSGEFMLSGVVRTVQSAVGEAGEDPPSVRIEGHLLHRG